MISCEPDLDVFRLARELAPDQCPRFVGRGDLDDGRIAQIERRIVDGRDQGAGDAHSRRCRRALRRIAHIEIPEGAADVDDARYTAGEVDLESSIQPRLVSGDFAGVGHCHPKVGRVRPGVEIPRLEEVNVRIDEAGHDPFAASIHDRGTCGDRHGVGGADGADAAVSDKDHAVRGDGPSRVALRMNDGTADNG